MTSTNHLLIVAKGVAMGAADVVPGVSGGTIALLTGIYPRLINAITGVNVQSVKQLLRFDFKSFWQAIDGNFILPLLFGIALAFAVLAHPIKYALTNHPIVMWSFFFGLIIASAILIIQHIPHKRLFKSLWIIPGIAFGFWIGSMDTIAFPSNQIAVFIAGMLAICAMILPGISGSFILVLIGMYKVLITAVAQRNLVVILIFIAGAVIGLLIFSRIIKWTLENFYQATLFFLSGLMLGSLVKVWPWQVANANVMPWTLENPQTFTAIALMLLAIILVFATDKIGRKYSS